MPKGLKAEWANLPRKRCKNCPAIFKPKRPNQEFCQPNCRKEFDKHGGTFSKLKPEIIKEVRKQVKERDPLDAEWQRKVETRLDILEARQDMMEKLLRGIGTALDLRRSA